MSAYLSSNDAISALATFWAEAHPRDPYALARAIYLSQDEPLWAEAKARADELLEVTTPAEACFKILLDANVESLAARYGEEQEVLDAAATYCYRRSNAAMHWIYSNNVKQIIGILRGYDYWASETRMWHRSLGHQICQQITDVILRMIPQEETWASWEEPSDLTNLTPLASLLR
ncbi:MAG: hypothetical protein WBM08_09365 [Prochlorococcaceae cyanobacterium]